MRVPVFRAPYLGLALLSVVMCSTVSGCSHSSSEQTFQYQGGNLRGGAIDYDRTPPPGGPYSPLWQKCAAYTHPIYPEYALHSVARGAVWLTYRPDLAPSDIQELNQLITDLPDGAGAAQLIVSPLPQQGTAVIATAWNVQRSFEQPDLRGVKQFIRNHASSKDAPEAGAGCTGGLSDTQSGTKP